MSKIQATLQEYRKLDTPALVKKMIETKRKLQELQSELAIRKLTNHAAIGTAKRELARLATVVREKQILASITQDE